MTSLKSIIIFSVLFLSLHIIATIYHLYWIFAWFDMPMHFLGGFLLAMVFFWINPKIEIANPQLGKFPKWLVNFVFALSFVILIGVLWEFYEFVRDLYVLGINNPALFKSGVVDKMKDLFFDLVGAAAGFVLFY